MGVSELEQCFRANEFREKHSVLHDRGCFMAESRSLHHHHYEDFYQNGTCADMIFGTECTHDGTFYDVFLPSYAQVKRLMDLLETNIVSYLKKHQGLQESEIGNITCFYLMPNTAFGMESFTPYKKIPCTAQGFSEKFLNSPEESRLKPCDEYGMFVVRDAPACCIIVNDVFDVGETEFQLIAKIVDEVLPNMTKEQCSQFKIVLSAIYLTNGRDKEAEVCFDGKRYPIGVMAFRGSVSDRLMANAKLHVMDDYIASQTQPPSVMSWVMSFISEAKPSKKEELLALEYKERCLALRNIFDKDRCLERMAYKRYLTHVASRCVYKLSVDDFVTAQWIDKERANNMRIAMPTTSLSPTISLDLAKPLQYLFNNKGIKHCLEPILYLPLDVLDQPVMHAQVIREHTNIPCRHEAHLLQLQPCDDGHYCVKEGWLSQCQSRINWEEDETIGVILFDPYNQDSYPSKDSHPHLLADVVNGMRTELQDNGYTAQFFHLSRQGHFSDYPLAAPPQSLTDYPSASWKAPITSWLVEDTVRVVWDSTQFFYDIGINANVRTSA